MDRARRYLILQIGIIDQISKEVIFPEAVVSLSEEPPAKAPACMTGAANALDAHSCYRRRCLSERRAPLHAMSSNSDRRHQNCGHGSSRCAVNEGHAAPIPTARSYRTSIGETKDGHFRVRLRGARIGVPEGAAIREPNRMNRTMVWPIFREHEILIRCFMPGSMS